MNKPITVIYIYILACTVSVFAASPSRVKQYEEKVATLRAALPDDAPEQVVVSLEKLAEALVAKDSVVFEREARGLEALLVTLSDQQLLTDPMSEWLGKYQEARLVPSRLSRSMLKRRYKEVAFLLAAVGGLAAGIYVWQKKKSKPYSPYVLEKILNRASLVSDFIGERYGVLSELALERFGDVKQLFWAYLLQYRLPTYSFD